MPLEPEARLNASLRFCQPILSGRGSGVPEVLQSYNARKVHFSATVGEGPEVELFPA
jgi:hypothetical protein